MKRISVIFLLFLCVGVHTACGAKERVLLIGDSVSWGYYAHVKQMLTNECEVVHAAGNNASTAYGLEHLERWLGQEKWDVIHFNWGLHDMKYVSATNKMQGVAVDAGMQWVPVEQYEKNLDVLVQRLLKTGAKLIWCTTTPVPDGAFSRYPRAEWAYNAAAARVMANYPQISVNDLHEYIRPQREAMGGLKKDVHYSDAGSRNLANCVVLAIERSLGRSLFHSSERHVIRGVDTTGEMLVQDAIQRAIDSVSSHGGGRVVLPKGIYKVTGLRLNHGVTLELEEGAVIRPSARPDDYTNSAPVILAENVANIGIVGKGTVEGGADAFYQPDGVAIKAFKHPHFILHFKHCQNVTVEDVTLTKSVHWTCRLLCCDGVLIRDVTIRNRCYAQQNCSDGIDPVACRNVLIEGCDIETGDDGVVLKSILDGAIPRSDYPVMRNIVVRLCTIASTCNATKIGTETVGPIENVLFENITVKDHRERIGKNPIPSGTCIAALSIQSNDGAPVKNIVCRNYTIEHCYSPAFVQLQVQKRKGKKDQTIGCIDGVIIENMMCAHAEAAMQINVATNARLKAITLRNIAVNTYETLTNRVIVAPRPVGRYAEAKVNGPMPAYGLFVRDVDQLTVENVKINDKANSGRTEILIENCTP